MVDRTFLRRYHAGTIFHRIRIEPGVSQSEIIARTGFDKSTVSSIVNTFIEQGLVERRAKANGTGRGRPSEGLAIAPGSGVLVGVEVETTKIIFVLCGLDGSVLTEKIAEYDGDSTRVVELILEGIPGLLKAGKKARVLGMGVSLPGLVNNQGALVHVPALGWRDVDILRELESRLSWPVFVGNDGKAAAMAEHMFGACVDMENFIYMFSGSGVGGALFLDGSVYKGDGGLAGELGHIKIVPQGRFCTCGASGCLSAYLTEPALVEEIGRLGSAQPRNFSNILELAQSGDPIVLNVLEHAGDVLGSAISSLINIFNPPVVLLGGDLALGQAYLSPAMERSLQRLAHPAMYSRSTVKFADPTLAAPRLGGVALALDGITALQGPHVLP